MIKTYVVFIIIILTVGLSSCKYFQKPATGPEDEIIVIADSSEFRSVEPALDSTFQKIIYTPQPEKLFTLKQVPENRLEQYKNRKNIIVIAPFNSNSNTAKFIRSSVDTAVKSAILADSVFEITKLNLWARDQLIMVLTAPTIRKLNSHILKDKDNLLYAFQKISDKRLYESLYSSRYERKKIEGKFLKDYGWVIYVEADYQVAQNKPKYNFVWLRRGVNTDMERWIFIHWINNATPAYLNPDSIRAVRNRMTKKFYRTTDDSSYVVIAGDYYTTSEVNFQGKYALLTQGLWELNTKGMGGPFLNYTFYDEKSHRIYMIDGSIYAPKYYKRNLIQQMDVMLQSFRTKASLSKDRIEELMDAAK
jgi:hypothetical protein